MSAPTDAGVYYSDSILFNVIGGVNIASYESLKSLHALVGGVNEVCYYSLPLNYFAIGNDRGEIYYESYALTAEAQILYAWGRDREAGRVSSNIAQAISIKLVEV